MQKENHGFFIVFVIVFVHEIGALLTGVVGVVGHHHFGGRLENCHTRQSRFVSKNFVTIGADQNVKFERFIQENVMNWCRKGDR